MYEWEELEQNILMLLDEDNPICPKNSGGTKKEEDVVGFSTISQCKYTKNKDIHIKHKDIDRLNSSAHLLHKFPLFFTQCEAGTFVTLQLDKGRGKIKLLLELLMVIQGARSIEEHTNYIKDMRQLKASDKLANKILKIFNRIKHIAGKKVKEMEDAIDRVTLNLQTYNLFDQGEEDGIEQGKKKES